MNDNTTIAVRDVTNGECNICFSLLYIFFPFVLLFSDIDVRAVNLLGRKVFLQKIWYHLCVVLKFWTPKCTHLSMVFQDPMKCTFLPPNRYGMIFFIHEFITWNQSSVLILFSADILVCQIEYFKEVNHPLD